MGHTGDHAEGAGDHRTTEDEMPEHATGRRQQGDRGAAMVEFAFVGVLLVVLLLGIVVMGFLLSFKQNITQAAAEGARAVVGITDDPTTNTDERDPLVESTLDSVVASYTDNGCGSSGIQCLWKIHACADDTSDFTILTDSRPGTDECITVRVEFANQGDTRIFPPIPLISALEPETIASQSTARLQT